MRSALLLSSFIMLTQFSAQQAAIAQPTPGGAGNLVITEIMYNPPEAGSDSLEFIEVMNTNATSAVNLTGLHFSSGVEFTFPDNLMLGPGELVVVAKDSLAFATVFGSVPLEWDAQSLLNTGEGIGLRDGANNLVDTVNYNDANPWPQEANGNGASLVLCDPLSDNLDENNWYASENNTGILVNGLTIFADPGAVSICTTVGIAQNTGPNELNVYPNPSNGEFSVDLNSGFADARLTMFNSVGQLCMTGSIAAGENSFRFESGLTPGVYLLKVNSGSFVASRVVVIYR